mgnify:CR=1 FL=1|jgi:hypothetical protein
MFLTPIFLIAAAVGAGVPILLHLMQSKRKVTMPFPTLRFLKVAEKRSSSKVRLENLLLWLLRTLIMLLLGMSFAMPMLRKSTFSWVGNAPRDVAIIIDGSSSMTYRKSGTPVWDSAIETATAIVDGLNEKDRVCLFVARAQPETLISEPVSDKADVSARLKGITPGPTDSRIAPAIEEAANTLKKSSGNREMEIHIITDNQALPWEDMAPDGDSPLDGLEKTTVFVSLLGVESPENFAPVDVAITPSRLQKGTESSALVSFSRTGPAGASTAILSIDGKEVGRRSIKVSEGTAEPATFRIPPLEPGIHSARIDTPDDNLPADNSFHFILNVQKSLPSLVVGTGGDTLFVQIALKTGLGNPDAVQSIAPDALAGTGLHNYSCVILCNALPLSGQAINALDSYVTGGGMVVIFPGIKASAGDYKGLKFLPAFPKSVDAVPASQARRSLSWDKPMHPLVRPLRDGSSSPTLSLRRQVSWERVDPTSETIVSLSASEPFLLERRYGKGRVLMFAVAPDRSTSDFPLSPFYLPMLVQCADYAAPSPVPFLEGTGTIVLNEIFPGIAEAPTVSGPSGKAIPVRGNTLEGRTTFIIDNLRETGIYKLSMPGDSSPRFALALNPPRAESNLTVIASEEIQPRLGDTNVKVAQDLPALNRLIEENRVGRTFGEQLLWLVLLLAVVEFGYANALSRRGEIGANKVDLDYAGHIKKKKPTKEGAA